VKLELVKLGKRAEKPQTLEVRGVTHQFALRPLDGGEYAQTLRYAREYAVRSGVKEPKQEDPLYQFGLALKTIELSCIDTDSPAERRTSFFAGGPSEIEAALGRDEIAFLFEAAELHQSECSPVKNLSPGEMFTAMVKLVEEEAAGSTDFFLSLSPATRLRHHRISARLALSSLGGKFSTSSLSDIFKSGSGSDTPQ
jgi:hypothetical protein